MRPQRLCLGMFKGLFRTTEAQMESSLLPSWLAAVKPTHQSSFLPAFW